MASMGRRGTLGGLWSESVFGCFSHCLFLDYFIVEVRGQGGCIHGWRKPGSNVSGQLVRLRGLPIGGALGGTVRGDRDLASALWRGLSGVMGSAGMPCWEVNDLVGRRAGLCAGSAALHRRAFWPV